MGRRQAGRPAVFGEAVAYAHAVLERGPGTRAPGEAIRRRVADRAGSFLATLERTVFANRESPYLPLLRAAGHDLAGLRRLVGSVGVESTLHRLCADGVYLSVDEFKARTPVRRGELTLTVPPGAFGNVAVGTGLTAWTGGSSGERVPIVISAENHRMGAEHLAVALSAYGLDDAPVVVWLTYAHGACVWVLLALAAAGRPVPRCWTHLPADVRESEALDARYLGIRAAARARGMRLPRPDYVPIGEEARILEWLRSHPRRPLGFFTTPSSALRLALAARAVNELLDGVTFITIAEPLTRGKLGAIEAAGARAFSSFGLTEFGRLTYGCARPLAPDDGHLCLDAVATARRRRVVDRFGTEVESLLVTTIRPDARQVLLNVESGDYVDMTARQCGCPLGALGWSEHVANIRSFEKLNAEGPPFSGAQLIELVDDVLPRRFGGSANDYQLVEEEDRDGYTRLSIVVHPRLGSIDEAALLECVTETLWSTHGMATQVWDDAGTVRVRRHPPVLTRSGKFLPVHHLKTTDAV